MSNYLSSPYMYIAHWGRDLILCFWIMSTNMIEILRANVATQKESATLEEISLIPKVTWKLSGYQEIETFWNQYAPLSALKNKGREKEGSQHLIWCLASLRYGISRLKRGLHAALFSVVVYCCSVRCLQQWTGNGEDIFLDSQMHRH